MRQIAEELAVAPYGIQSVDGGPLPEQTIHAALGRVRKGVQARLCETAEEETVLQLAQLEHIQSEAMSAWEQSKGQARTVTKRQIGDGSAPAGQGGSVGAEYTTRLEEQAGETAYLRTAMAAMEARRKILGIDAPIKHLDVSKMSDEQLRDIIERSRGRKR